MNEQNVHSFSEAVVQRLKYQLKPSTGLMFRPIAGSDICAADVDWTVITYQSLSKEAQFIAAEVAQACATKLPGGNCDANFLCEMLTLLKKAEADDMLRTK